MVHDHSNVVDLGYQCLEQQRQDLYGRL
jgi:hypothetical protein